MQNKNFSIVIPAKNEARSIGDLLKKLNKLYPSAEIIVVDDGSTDDTREIASKSGAKVVSHPYSLGNGAAIKTGARNASQDKVVFMDADGQHPPELINDLVNLLDNGYCMAIGARSTLTHASIGRRMANSLYNKLASFITNFPVKDLTSGFRAVDRRLFNRFLYLLPNGFSYPTTITMAFLRSGYPIVYFPFQAKSRKGRSHIAPLVDGLRFLIIIVKVGSLYSPLKFFTPPSITLFLIGVLNYVYTFVAHGTFTNMSALLMIVSVIIFMMGLLAEQITVLTYAASQRRSQDGN